MLHYLSIPYVIWLSFIGIKSHLNHSITPPIEAIEFRDSSPWFGENIKRVYYTGSFVVYQSQYTYTTSSAYVSADGTSNQGKLDSMQTSSEERKRFFVFHKDSTYGVRFDPLDSMMDNRRLAVDSARLEIQGRNTLERLLSMTADSVSWNAEHTELREVYVCKGNKDTPTVRMVMHYSNQMNQLRASINPILDKAKNMKLYRTEFLLDEFFDERVKQCLPPMKYMTEIKGVTVTNTEEVTHYINRYQKSVGLKP